MAGLLASIEVRMESADLPACSAGELMSLTSDVNHGIRQLVGYLTCLAGEARSRERGGGSVTAQDVMRCGGEVSTREAERRAERAGVADRLPLTGRAARSGSARPENLDAVGRALARLSPAQQAGLVELDAEIAERSGRLPPETFERYLGREARRLRRTHRDPDGEELSHAEREKARSRFDIGRRNDGRWWLSGDFDQERGALINDIVAQRARDVARDTGNDGPTASTRATALHDLLAANLWPPGPHATQQASTPNHTNHAPSGETGTTSSTSCVSRTAESEGASCTAPSGETEGASSAPRTAESEGASCAPRTGGAVGAHSMSDGCPSASTSNASDTSGAFDTSRASGTSGVSSDLGTGHAGSSGTVSASSATSASDCSRSGSSGADRDAGSGGTGSIGTTSGAGRIDLAGSGGGGPGSAGPGGKKSTGGGAGPGSAGSSGHNNSTGGEGPGDPGPSGQNSGTNGGGLRLGGRWSLDPPGGGDGWGYRRLGIGYIVDALTLAAGPHPGSVAQTWHGEDIDPLAAGRLACDADLYAILLDRCGAPTGVGRTRRSATRDQRLALRALYAACPLDGTPFGRCEIHHVNMSFEHGGATELDNLVPISPEWHHRIHDRGWTLHMAPDRTLTLRRPDGTTDRTITPPTPLTRTRP